MLKRFSRSKKVRALLIAAGSYGILTLLLFSQTLPAQSALVSRLAVQAPELPTGDPENGQALFLGKTPLENDGPPCMSCHNVSGVGLLGGGSVGPDLTDLAAWYTEAELASDLADIPFPTMKPSYSAHPLTPAERADLSAFLLVPRQSQQNNVNALVVLGVGLLGCVAAAGFFGFIYRWRLRSVRKALVAQTLFSRRSM